MAKFTDFNFSPPLQKALDRMGFETPTEVQAQTIPLVLQGKDVLATAQTGTGKTAAFAVPILNKFLEAGAAEGPNVNQKKALIIAPTRELAEQIGEVIRELTWSARRFRYTVIIGGASYGKQISELREKPFFVVGTPGRLIDPMKSGVIKMEDYGYLVLDEADRMLDMGFEPQIEQLVARMPKPRQTMMFSATLPPEVRKMVARYLNNPTRVAIGEENVPVDRIKQDLVEAREGEKAEALIREIDKVAGTIIVFTRTRLRADLVADALQTAGHYADSLHGDLSQAQRKRVITKFREESLRILVATDIAARGLDVTHVRHVINYDLPMVPEDYIHRIGRTGRNGAEGHSIAFVAPQEKHLWFRICRLIGAPVPKQMGKESRHEGKFRSGAKPERSSNKRNVSGRNVPGRSASAGSPSEGRHFEKRAPGGGRFRDTSHREQFTSRREDRSREKFEERTTRRGDRHAQGKDEARSEWKPTRSAPAAKVRPTVEPRTPGKRKSFPSDPRTQEGSFFEAKRKSPAWIKRDEGGGRHTPRGGAGKPGARNPRAY